MTDSRQVRDQLVPGQLPDGVAIQQAHKDAVRDGDEVGAAQDFNCAQDSTDPSTNGRSRGNLIGLGWKGEVLDEIEVINVNYSSYPGGRWPQ